MSLNLTEAERDQLAALDRTPLGRILFDLLSDCRTELSQDMRMPASELPLLIDQLDDILGAVAEDA